MCDLGKLLVGSSMRYLSELHFGSRTFNPSKACLISRLRSRAGTSTRPSFQVP